MFDFKIIYEIVYPLKARGRKFTVEENYVEEIYKQMPQTEKFQFSCNMSEPEFAEQQIQLCLGYGVKEIKKIPKL